MVNKLLVLIFSGMVWQTAALRVDSPACPSISDILGEMEQHVSEPVAQITGCRRIAMCVNGTREGQNEAVKLGSINASIKAMQQFPDDLLLQDACITANTRAILKSPWARYLAGRLGGLNATLAAYRRWMHTPQIAYHGSSIGDYLINSTENLAILRELGGVQLLIQNIRNNFHRNDSNQTSIRDSLEALSNGCWRNSDLCYKEGFVQLAMQLMDEYMVEDGVVGLTLLTVKAMTFENSSVRKDFSEAGLMPVLVKLLRRNQSKQVTKLACEHMSMMTGPVIKFNQFGTVAYKAMSHDIQGNATRDGVLDQLLATLMGGVLEETDDAQAECIGALMRMAWEHSGNAEAIRQAGFPDRIEGKLVSGSFKNESAKAACTFLSKPGFTPAKTTSELCHKLDCGLFCLGNQNSSASR